MQIKKYEAPSMQEALDTIKRELGPEAIVLQTRQHKRRFGILGKPSVEVTVAVSDRALNRKQVVEARIPDKTREVIQSLPAQGQADVYDSFVKKTQEKVELSRSAGTQNRQTRYIDIPDDTPVARSMVARADSQAMQEEIARLKRMILELKTQHETSARIADANKKGSFPSSALQEAYDHLVLGGLERRHAYALVKQAEFALSEDDAKKTQVVQDAIASELLRIIQTAGILEGIRPRAADDRTTDPALIALVGPPGAGKTTTLAKLAGEAIKTRGLKVALIAFGKQPDQARAATAMFAKLFGIPFRTVETPEALAKDLADFRSLDLLLIDTYGATTGATDSLARLEKLSALLGQTRFYLTVAASMRDEELAEIGKRFSVVHPAAIIFTHLDESLAQGGLINLSLRLKLPLAAFGTGQTVPDDLEPATGERLVSLMMDF